MNLILARHGNTFEAGETPTWVGCRNDLPLTKTGIEQATILAHYLKNNNLKLVDVYCGPLQRTRIYAKTILNELLSPPVIPARKPKFSSQNAKHNRQLNKLNIKSSHLDSRFSSWDNNVAAFYSTQNFEPIIDQRLNEIDYGEWSGLTNSQVREQFGAEELERWEKYSKWPTTGNWKGSEAATVAKVTAFVDDLIKKYPSNTTILAVSSNGLLRYFLKLIPNEFDIRIKNQTLKIATGKMCKLIYENNQWKIDFWNVGPLDKNNLIR
jgi:broad specificity phosphatase PhoE